MKQFASAVVVLALSACTVYDRIELVRDRNPARPFTETSVPVLVLAPVKGGELDQLLHKLTSNNKSSVVGDGIRDLLSRSGEYQRLLGGDVPQKSITVEIWHGDSTVFSVEIARRGQDKRVLWVVADLQSEATKHHLLQIDDPSRTQHRIRVLPDGLQEDSPQGGQ